VRRDPILCGSRHSESQSEKHQSRQKQGYCSFFHNSTLPFFCQIFCKQQNLRFVVKIALGCSYGQVPVVASAGFVVPLMEYVSTSR
jgi:hypothetical protein